MSPQPDDSTKDRIFDFAHLFDEIDGAFSRRSPVPEHLLENFSDTVITSAISKCIDFNLLVNQELESELLPFFLMANSRSICEDLIYISFMRQLDRKHSNNLAAAIHWLKFRKNILAQTNFFAKNNPMQPTVGALHATKEQQSEINQAEVRLRQIWKDLGFPSVPSIRRLSLKVGLTTTYEYIYHMSSNFVHFNPGQLLRQGWGPHQGPFDFSAAHFANYHSDVCRYLGAILFLGYCYCCPDRFTNGGRDAAINEITSALQSNVRWPEIVTFEEMNQKVPNIILRALMSVYREEQSDSLPDILSELRSL